MEIILDTNFLVIAVKQKIQIFEQIEELYPSSEIIIPSQVIEELNKLKKNKALKIIEREAAELSLELIKKKSISNVKFITSDTDAGIIRYATKNDIVVGTLDRELKARIKAKNPKTKFLVIRNTKHIVLQ